MQLSIVGQRAGRRENRIDEIAWKPLQVLHVNLEYLTDLFGRRETDVEGMRFRRQRRARKPALFLPIQVERPVDQDDGGPRPLDITSIRQRITAYELVDLLPRW